MTTRIVSSLADGSGTGSSRLTGYTTMTLGLAAMVAGDDLVIDLANIPTDDSSGIAADRIYTIPAGCRIIGADFSNDTTWTHHVATSTTPHIGHPTSNFALSFTGAVSCIISGLRLRISGGGTSDNLSFATADGSCHALKDCFLDIANTNNNCRIIIGDTTTSRNSLVPMTNTTVKFGATAQGFEVRGTLEWIGGGVDSSGSIPANLIQPNSNGRAFIGRGLTLDSVTNVLGNASTGKFDVTLYQCSLGASTTLIGTQTPANRTAGEAVAWHCSFGTTLVQMVFANSLGTITCDSNIHLTASSAALSWKIVTTPLATKYDPFVTPFIYHYVASSGSAKTPVIQLARDGSTTLFTNAEVASTWLVLESGSHSRGTVYNTVAAPESAGTNLSAGSGTGTWTGLSGTATSMQISPGSVTPGQVGDIAVQLSVYVDSTTLYVDPFVQGMT